MFQGKLGQENRMIMVTSSISKSSVFQSFSLHTKTQSRRFQIPSVVLKNFFFKLRFRHGLLLTVGLTVEIKLRF